MTTCLPLTQFLIGGDVEEGILYDGARWRRGERPEGKLKDGTTPKPLSLWERRRNGLSKVLK